MTQGVMENETARRPVYPQCIRSVSATSVSAVYPPRVKGKQAADVQVSPVRLLNAISNVFELEAKLEKESNSKLNKRECLLLALVIM